MTENFTNDFFFGGGVSIGPHVKNILLFLIFANPFFFFFLPVHITCMIQKVTCSCNNVAISDICLFNVFWRILSKNWAGATLLQVFKMCLK